MYALMGSSGCGKTTLLNTLNKNLPRNMKRTGTILLNGTRVNMRKIAAYIQQKTLFFEQFSVREHLKFYMRLHKPHKNLHEEQDENQQLNNLAEIFSLTKCLNTRIGNGISEGGISGGERKRLSIASEVIKMPSIIFADEPTTGLDSSMAESVIASLKELSHYGIMVIVSIHQPSTEVFNLFTNICLLSAGELVTCAKIQNITRIFKLACFPCPTDCNPADHIINSTACIVGREEECSKRVQKIKMAAKNFNSIPKIDIESKQVKKKRKFKILYYNASFLTQLWEIMLRDLKTNTRDPFLLASKFVHNTVLTLVSGLIFYQMPFQTTTFVKYIGAIFLLTITGTFTNIFSIVNNFPLEFDIYKRETQSMMYGPTAYFFSKILCEIPFNIVINLAFVSVAYFLVGYRNLPESYLWTLFISFLLTEVEISFAYCISTMTSNIQKASSITLGLTSIAMMLGGFLVPASNLPNYINWLSYVSWFKYSLESITIVQFADYQIGCDNQDIPHCQTNKTIDGTYAFYLFNFEKEHFVRNILALVGLIILYRSISFIALVVRTYIRT